MMDRHVPHASTQEVLGAFLFLGIFNELAKKIQMGQKYVYFFNVFFWLPNF
jgi:hypothetical protein